MPCRFTIGLSVVLVLAALAPASAEPDLRTVRAAGPLQVCRDSVRAQRYYIMPPDLTIARDETGRPDLHLLQMRYTGSATTGDQGVVRYRSLLSFRVLLPAAGAEELRAARQDLGLRPGTGDFRPLPITQMHTALVFAPISETGTGPLTSAPTGALEALDETGRTTARAYWTERTYTVALDDLTSQAMWSALDKGQVLVSLGYALYAAGIAPEQAQDELTGTPELVSELRKQLGLDPPDPDAPPAATPPTTGVMVRASALAVTVDPGQWPELRQQIDINESLPAGYGILEIRCYDFAGGLRPDLAEKQVELDAEAVDGSRVRLQVVFEAGQPDLAVRMVRYPVAVRMGAPYRYRLSEVGQDGKATVGEWREVSSWAWMLDVTSPPPTVPAELDEEALDETLP